MEEKELAYIAGFVDGEGCISIFRQTVPRVSRTVGYRPSVSISNTDKSVLEYIQRLFGGRIYQRAGKHLKSHWKPQYTWNLVATDSVPFLEAILPFLQVKQEQAKLLIKFQQYRQALPNRGRQGYTSKEWATLRQWCLEIHCLNQGK